jgi:hypothetical protein
MKPAQWQHVKEVLAKNKRGEFESDEHEGQQKVADQIARCDAALHESSVGKH